MKRRDFLALAGAVATAPTWPLAGLAQQAAKVPHVVILDNGITDVVQRAMSEGLGDYGYVDGKNIAVEFLNAPTIADVPAYAVMAVAKKPDVIWTLSSAPPLAVKALTTSIPVVFTYLQDPVAIGIVSNYARPDGNLTGNMLAGTDYTGKQIEIIREVLPSISRLAILGLPADPPYPIMLSRAQSAAKALNIETVLFETKEGDDLAPIFDAISAAGAQAVYIILAQYLIGVGPQLADLALRHKLPSFMGAQDAPDGILVGFSSDMADVVRHSAAYVDAILKGTKPADLPIEQPTTFQLILNVKTAKALDITFSPSLLLQATQVLS